MSRKGGGPPRKTGHLSDTQLGELSEELLRQLERLKKSMKITDEALRTVELDQTAVGRLSRMDSLQNQALSAGLREREAARLGQIVAALQRVDAGLYGTCASCGAGIPFERLFVFPEAPECASCVA
ncbi:MAG: TraR/DksA family transcriptional regulator [Gemmatimonadetes bacterium]|nr:TraR/DksA family transcriptional regulator [Gemmatimonadota bacterium]NNF14496.1 TraR/DksA family transcriptional regulator [Gemmatimonadota bacterium]NNL29610.1 TraR/DksA family transcriptional regulator [Gemmatimonadota bacterium]